MKMKEFGSGGGVPGAPLDPPVQTAHNLNRSETKSAHACFTQHAKYMTLSVLETSLPMQRIHETLALDISA